MPHPTPTEQLLATLIAFDTTSHRSNLAMIEWIANHLTDLGLEPALTYDDSGCKANLFTRLGGGRQPTIILSGHSDVVPVAGQNWQSDPFTLQCRDGRLYGRGSADMKGFIAATLAAASRWRQSGAADALPLSLAISYDEEVGCLGVSRLIDDICRRGIPVAGCIVGEPTSMQAVVAHKGIAHWRCHVHGREAHSSLTPQGVNAIEYAARLICFVEALAAGERSAMQQPSLFDVPFNTLQTGWIQGGSAPNIVPRDCEFIVECRWLPGEDPGRFIRAIEDYASQLLLQMRKVAPDAAIDFTPLVHCPAFECGDDNPLRDWILRLAAQRPGKAVAYTTEAGHFARAGIPAVVCGPGSIEQAHRPDEFIARSELAACDAWLDALAQGLLRRGQDAGFPVQG